MSFHCNARFISKLILDRRIRDGEFIRDRFADFAALICFANCRDCRYDDYGYRQYGHASKQLHDAVRLWRPARQSATTRVSNPNGIAAGTSSSACAADCSNRSICSFFIAFLFPKFSRAVVSFSAGLEMLAL